VQWKVKSLDALKMKVKAKERNKHTVSVLDYWEDKEQIVDYGQDMEDFEDGTKESDDDVVVQASDELAMAVEQNWDYYQTKLDLNETKGVVVVINNHD
jgi:hypothetical protein